MGEALPTATWRTSPIRSATTAASSSSSRKSGCAAFIDILVEILRKAFVGRREPHIFLQVLDVPGVIFRQRQRPAAVLHHRDRLDIKAGQGAGGERLVFQQIAV